MSKILFNNMIIDGTTLPHYEVGKEHEIILQLYNDYDVPVTIREIKSNIPEVIVLDFTQKLNSRETGILKISILPEENRITPLLPEFVITEEYD